MEPEEHHVSVVFIERPGEEDDPNEAWGMKLSAESITQDDVVRTLYGALHDECGSERSPYILQTRREHYSWGAEAMASAVVLFVAGAAAAGIIGNAAYDALKSAVRKLREEHRVWCELVGRDEALERGIWMLEQRYGLNRAAVSVVSEEQAGETFRFRLRSTDESATYDVSVEASDGLVLVTKTGRSKDT